MNIGHGIRADIERERWPTSSGVGAVIWASPNGTLRTRLAPEVGRCRSTAMRTISAVDQPLRFCSYGNRLALAGWTVLAIGLAWLGLNAVLIGLAGLLGLSAQLAFTVSTVVCAALALTGIVIACRVALCRDEARGTVTVVNLLSRSEFDVRDVVAVRIVPFPWVRQRGPSATTNPMLEVKTTGGSQIRLLATAVGTKRGRTAALDFLRAARVGPLPSRAEYVDLNYVAQEWTSVGSRARSGRK